MALSPRPALSPRATRSPRTAGAGARPAVPHTPDSGFAVAEDGTRNPDNDVLRAHDVTVTRGPATILRRMSVGIRADETFAVTGPTGAGKSALLAVLSGVIAPDAGQVWFNSRPLHTLGDRARGELRRTHFGMLDGRARLMPELTVLENVALPLLLEPGTRGTAFAAARHWMGRLDVLDHADQRPHQLPPALLRRAAVARALVVRPDVVFADEPGLGLHGAELDHLMRILVSASRSHGIALVLATDDPQVARHADRTLELRDGRPVPVRTDA
ncbi:ABC transporter ATP-binding protein [Uniformispora flossi]|uniref:ABC transporter ATP-binding protein n=1 Tax=Uniformispora flossi TaxID=3390723 RepID=UPI003C2E6B93